MDKTARTDRQRVSRTVRPSGDARRISAMGSRRRVQRSQTGGSAAWSARFRLSWDRRSSSPQPGSTPASSPATPYAPGTPPKPPATATTPPKSPPPPATKTNVSSPATSAPAAAKKTSPTSFDSRPDTSPATLEGSGWVATGYTRALLLSIPYGPVATLAWPLQASSSSAGFDRAGSPPTLLSFLARALRRSASASRNARTPGACPGPGLCARAMPRQQAVGRCHGATRPALSFDRRSTRRQSAFAIAR